MVGAFAAAQAATDYWPQVITGIFTLFAGVTVALIAWRHQAKARKEDRQQRNKEREEDRAQEEWRSLRTEAADIASQLHDIDIEARSYEARPHVPDSTDRFMRARDAWRRLRRQIIFFMVGWYSDKESEERSAKGRLRSSTDGNSQRGPWPRHKRPHERHKGRNETN
jgi:hypothetical protein